MMKYWNSKKRFITGKYLYFLIVFSTVFTSSNTNPKIGKAIVRLGDILKKKDNLAKVENAVITLSIKNFLSYFFIKLLAISIKFGV